MQKGIVRLAAWPSRAGLVGLECVECFVCISDKRKTHFCFLLVGHGTDLSSVCSTRVFLWDFVYREVRDIDVRAESRLERCPDFAQLIPNNTAEERVVFNLRGAAMLSTIVANTMLRVTQETKSQSQICLFKSRAK